MTACDRWAAAEHLHETNKSRALFATHYHEMVALCERLTAMTCVTMKVKEWNVPSSSCMK